jgi:hypothetical protein
VQFGCTIHSLPTAKLRLAAPITQGLRLRLPDENNLHLSGSEGNFSGIQQDVGLSLAHTALSASAGLLSFVTADDNFLQLYYRKNESLCQANQA